MKVFFSHQQGLIPLLKSIYRSCNPFSNNHQQGVCRLPGSLDQERLGSALPRYMSMLLLEREEEVQLQLFVGIVKEIIWGARRL